MASSGLVSLLHRAEVQCHPFIIGELACGSISRRSETLQLLRRLPSVPVVENEEVMTFVERHRLMGRGVGWVDVAANRRPGCLTCTPIGVHHSLVC
jgi:predicted nucleic acid-binding protein